ncbi:hypothetical protein HYC85_029233 [Camellia sinensis]|uniref:Uncharacterized protein n=1 Tax=Camellia sinensis TaxID=4442 RepID=A0A7J7FXH7_CAMSI|nr:hypothetical protein HYC85_029233 [Camellia sinensis]
MVRLGHRVRRLLFLNECASTRNARISLQVRFRTIASDQVDIPQALLVRGRRLNRSRDLIDGQQSLNSQAEVLVSIAESDILVVQLDQGSMAGLEEMMCQLQESMKAMQQDATYQAEVAARQVEVVTQQAKLITRLQQQTEASASHTPPPPPRVPILGEMPNVQENMDVPTGPAPPPILPQQSKVPTNLVDSPFAFEVDPTTLKVSKLEKLFKKSQGVKSIPDIEDGYTDSAMTLPD